MKIQRITAYRIDLPLHEGSYKWSGGKSVSVFDSTVIEVETEDRVGLLYAISQTLGELAVDIVAAKILTEKGAAIDTFYVRELDGKKILASERQRSIERKLRHALHALEG